MKIIVMTIFSLLALNVNAADKGTKKDEARKPANTGEFFCSSARYTSVAESLNQYCDSSKHFSVNVNSNGDTYMFCCVAK